MSLYINKNDIDIIDRDFEAKRVAQIISEVTNAATSHILLLCADSGYGKSSIMKKVKNSNSIISKQIVIVDTPPVNNNAVPVEGQYLSHIAETLNHVLRSTYSLASFLYSSDCNYQISMDVDTLLQAGISPLAATVAIVGQPAFSNLKADRLLFDNSADSILLLKNYIESAITRNNIVLDITNAQNMDLTSYRVICSILQALPSKVMVMEYTTEGNDCSKAAKFSSGFSCPYTLMEIDELPFEFALSLIGIPNEIQRIREIEQFYHNVIKGNLYKIVQAKMDGTSDALNYQEDPLQKKIDELGFASKLLLCILCLHDGELDNSSFNAILEFIDKSFFIPSNWGSDLDSLLDESNGKIRLRHASIAEFVPLNNSNAAALSAYRFLTTFYQNRCSLADDTWEHKQAIILLVKLHSRFDPIQMIPLLGQFKAVIIGMLSENDAFALIKQAFEALGLNKETEFHIRLIALCYEVGFYRGALELLQQLTPLSSTSGNVYLCMLLNRNDQHHEAILSCKTLLKSVKNSRYRLIVLIIKMLSERSLNRVRDYRKTFRTIEKQQDFHDILEYGFFLRNAQILFPYLKSLEYLENSIDFFLSRGERQYAAYSQLTYLIQLARLGELEKSNDLLNKIIPSLLCSSFEKHIVYVNQAAIRLLNRCADNETLHLLDKALLTVTTVFDRIVILNNMLCALIINKGKQREYERLKGMLEAEIAKEPDQRMRQKTYANFYLYCRDITKNTAEAQRWKDAVARLKIERSHQTIEQVLVFDEVPTKDLQFLATRNFCISFITYWHFDIPILDF